MNLLTPSTVSYTPGVFLTSLLRDHTNLMINRYSALRALRIDLWYQKGTLRFQQSDYRRLEHEARLLMQEMMAQKAMVGYFWVIEWTQDHGWHAHVVFWLDEHITQTTWPTSRKTSDIWGRLTDQEAVSIIANSKKTIAQILISQCITTFQPVSLIFIKYWVI